MSLSQSILLAAVRRNDVQCILVTYYALMLIHTTPVKVFSDVKSSMYDHFESV
jgi:hypothetical protein